MITVQKVRIVVAAILLISAFLVALSSSPSAHASQDADEVMQALANYYRSLEFYSDETISVMLAESENGEPIRNENKYRIVFHDAKGVMVDSYLGQMFLISDWETMTNWFKHPARYNVAPFDMAANWRDQFIPTGGMMDSEHPVLAMLLDRRTGRSDGAFGTLRRLDHISNVTYKGKHAFLVEGQFFFSAQGINFSRSEDVVLPGKIWIDADGFLRKAEYDITEAYSQSFGAVRKARFTVTHDQIKTQPPNTNTLNKMFAFTPRSTDVKRALSEIFTAPPSNKGDDGSPNYLLNRPAPLFTGATLSGEDFSMAQQRGKRVLLFFWGTWCPNSARAIGQIEQLSKAGIENLEVIGVNVDSYVGRAALNAYYTRRNLSFPTIVDEGNAITSLYRGVYVPSAFLIDSFGIVRTVDLGETEDLVERYTAVLSETP